MFILVLTCIMGWSLPFWQLFSLLGLFLMYRLFPVCLSLQNYVYVYLCMCMCIYVYICTCMYVYVVYVKFIFNLESFPAAVSACPYSFFFLPGHSGSALGWVLLVASGFGLVPVTAVCLPGAFIAFFCCLFYTPFGVSGFGFGFWFDWWSWGGWSHTSWPAFWLYLCLIYVALGFTIPTLDITCICPCVCCRLYAIWFASVLWGRNFVCLFSRTLMVVLLRMVIFTLLSLRFCQAQSCLDIWVGYVLLEFCIPWWWIFGGCHVPLLLLSRQLGQIHTIPVLPSGV